MKYIQFKLAGGTIGQYLAVREDLILLLDETENATEVICAGGYSYEISESVAECAARVPNLAVFKKGGSLIGKRIAIKKDLVHWFETHQKDMNTTVITCGERSYPVRESVSECITILEGVAASPSSGVIA